MVGEGIWPSPVTLGSSSGRGRPFGVGQASSLPPSGHFELPQARKPAPRRLATSLG